jgi:predicted nuclease of predicted toxin-antitoxin system
LSGRAGIRLVLDQGVPRDAANKLHHLGYKCTHVAELGMSTTSDHEILTWSAEKGAILVTLDADFHMILAVSGMSAPSVVRIRLQGLNASAITAIIEETVSDFYDDLVRWRTGHGQEYKDYPS